METYIKDLKLSQGTKIFLTWYMKITKVSELEGLNYLTFANKCPKNCNALAMADQNKRMNEHVGILQKKLCIFTKVYFSNTLYLTSKIVYTMPEMNQIIV